MDASAKTVDVPKLGKTKKVYVWGAVGLVAVYVGWKYYQSAQSAATGTDYTTDYVSPPLATGGQGSNDVTGYTTSQSETDTTSTVISTNAQWTNQAVELLSNAGYDAASVYAALGDFLNHVALTSTEQTIVRAALAAVGKPPTGGPFTITEQVGDVTLTAPTGLKATVSSPTSVTLTYTTVTGAASYSAYRSDTGTTVVGTGYGGSIVISGLTPNKSYTFSVAARSSNGKTGPKSSSVTVKMSGAALKAPTGLKVRSAATTSIQLQWTAVTGAAGYMIQQSGGRSWESTDAADTAVGLKSKTSYKFRVAALQPGTRTPGPWSSWLTAKTK